LREGEAETSQEADVEESTTGGVMSEWVSGARLVHRHEGNTGILRDLFE